MSGSVFVLAVVIAAISVGTSPAGTLKTAAFALYAPLKIVIAVNVIRRKLIA